MSQNPHTTAKGFFHSKTADRIGEFAFWAGLCGIAGSFAIPYLGGSQETSGLVLIVSCVVTCGIPFISAKHRRGDKQLSENMRRNRM